MSKLLTPLVLFCVWTTITAVMDGEMELLLVQAMWRHGDRSPTKTFKTDPFQEANWTFGGGGLGQLSPRGMKQHLDLGRLIRKTYIDEMKFISKRYCSKEIYIRSTDVNRTIASALSNLVGMYGQKGNNAVVGLDYPDDEGWPRGYIPIAIHTVDDDTDYVVNTDAICERGEILWNMAKNSKKLQAFQRRPDIATLLANLTEWCGETIDIDNLWKVRDALMIEQTHENEKLRATNPWFSDALFNEMTDLHNKIDAYKNGVFYETLIMNGLDIGLELQKIRGGSMFNELYMRMVSKLQCLNKSSPECKWINDLKYYAYSAHDSTIYAFFVILGIQDKVIHPNGYPAYSAATFIELWRNTSNNQPYFKLKYHQNDRNVTFYTITQTIDPCEGRYYCSLDIFRALAEKTKPDLPASQWCNINPLTQTSLTSSWALFTTAFVSTASVMWASSW